MVCSMWAVFSGGSVVEDFGGYEDSSKLRVEAGIDPNFLNDCIR